ncbi:YmaF family protein [Brevibacillus choshinensis]|uniref:YmaF family protein n=1 Tax=Brevibacillus choshinensis TaxID=54911 RepID=A0ABX7FLE8_BRECH|nr:YmaF family protein [Brevibacillus choshinensis]QRG66519.1 hypothetical protein JNE38_23810 [Brevibacillus choshinensis]
MNEQHSHYLRFMSICNQPGHVHDYDTQTFVSDRHRHRMSGRTSLPEGSEYQHTHYYEGTTSFNDGHVHSFSGWTGPPVPLPDGNHYHEFYGQTTFDDGHTHYYRGVTGEAF